MFRAVVVATLLAAPAAAMADCAPLLDKKFSTLDGKPFDFCALQGKAVLVVNTASRCGFTPQFEKLEGMYRRYKDRGLVVVGFPSNDFRQELDSNKAVGDFCRSTYGVEFPMIEKTSVTGDGANPLFRQLAQASQEAPRWNFHKYLIAPDGKTVYSFQTQVEPDSAAVMSKLEPMLKK
jgi:glutathione peroxidase